MLMIVDSKDESNQKVGWKLVDCSVCVVVGWACICFWVARGASLLTSDTRITLMPQEIAKLAADVEKEGLGALSCAAGYLLLSANLYLVDACCRAAWHWRWADMQVLMETASMPAGCMLSPATALTG